MSASIIVVRTVSAPVADVFASISDSDRLGSLPGVKVEVQRPGQTSRDGVGLLRRITFPGGFLLEEVVELEAPHRFGYRIRDSFPGFDHEWGEIRFEDVDGGTKVTWASRISIPAGPLTPIAERIGAAAGYVGFTTALIAIDLKLRG